MVDRKENEENTGHSCQTSGIMIQSDFLSAQLSQLQGIFRSVGLALGYPLFVVRKVGYPLLNFVVRTVGYLLFCSTISRLSRVTNWQVFLSMTMRVGWDPLHPIV